MASVELIALLTCDATATDPNGKVTIYGVFDRIWVKGFPAVHPDFAIFCKCYFSEPGEAHITMSGPDGAPLLPAENVPPIRADKPGAAQIIYRLSGLVLPTEGEYTLRLVTEDEQVGIARLEVLSRK